MNMLRTFVLVCGLLLLVSMIQAQNIFQVVMNVSDDNGGVGVLTFGAGRGYTYGIDIGAAFHPAEIGLPPAPPNGPFDARFVDTRTGLGAVLDQGVTPNIHPWPAQSTLDTFSVKWQLSTGATSIHFSWPKGLTIYFSSLSMKDAFGGAVVNWNMLVDTAGTVTNLALTQLFIYATIMPNGVKVLDKGVPSEFSLNQNYPNPFNPSTTIKFAIEKTSSATVSVYDVLGRQVATLVADQLTPGSYSTTWNGTDDHGKTVSSGVYYVRMNATYTSGGAEKTFSAVRKVLLMK